MIGKALNYLRGTLTSITLLDQASILRQRGGVRIDKKHGKIKIGHRTTLWPGVKLACIGMRGREALLVIGEKCSIGDRTQIHCGLGIRIGNGVKISWDCNILDRDYHAIDGVEEALRPVRIEDGVWIGCRVIIVKGVTIGKGSVIAAGSVVTKDVAPNSLVAGNPARFIRAVKWS